MFDGTLGNYTDTEYKIELLEGARPHQAQAFPIPKIYKETFKTDVNLLVNIGMFKRENNSEWAAPTFVIPKNYGTVCFISDFRDFDKRIDRKPFPIFKIQDLLLQPEGFEYASSLDLNIGYCHIKLCPFSNQL